MPGRAHAALADRWILSRLQATIADVTVALERFRLNDAANAASRFVWDELADWYVEAVKPRLRGEVAGGEEARRVLAHAFGTALRLLHPVVPFITETLARRLPGATDATTLVLGPWPAPDPAFRDPDAETAFALVQRLVNAIRSIRGEYGIAPRARLTAVVQQATPEGRRAIEAERATISLLAGTEQIGFDRGADGPGASAILEGATSVFVPLRDAIDVARECARLRGELERVTAQRTAVEAKLGDERFTARAPAEIVERERAKGQTFRDQCDVLRAKLHALGCR